MIVLSRLCFHSNVIFGVSKIIGNHIIDCSSLNQIAKKGVLTSTCTCARWEIGLETPDYKRAERDPLHAKTSYHNLSMFLLVQWNSMNPEL